MFPVFLFLVCLAISAGCRHSARKDPSADPALLVEVSGGIRSTNTGEKWSRCFLHAGIVYFRDSLMSRDGGRTIVPQEKVDLRKINGAPERAVFSGDRLFYALDGPVQYLSPGIYEGRSWRSVDQLRTLHEDKTLFHIPDGAPPLKNNTAWYGLFVYRTIVDLKNGTWLMTMYGNFAEDTLVPWDADARKETRYLQRTLIVISEDEGRNWTYRSTVAVAGPGDPVGEGFVEPAITWLDDGRLLCVMRSGHHYPLYACWSSDTGKTWTYPVYTGLDRGCDPCLITLHDGRVALSWGRRFPEGWSQVSPKGDKGRFVYPGEGYTNLSISNDGGMTWRTERIIRPAGSCYSTIMEVEPDVILMQSDQWYCRINLNMP